MPASPTTRWSLVQAARAGDPQGRAALSALCAAYRPVVLAWFRRHGDSSVAEDATQSFFLHFLEHRLSERADRDRGSFRAFLFAAVRNHQREAWRHAHAARRDGGGDTDDSALGQLADHGPEATAAFDRDWALRVIERGRERLRDECTASGKATLFEALGPFLAEPPAPDDYARIGAAAGLSANAVAVAVKRLRERLRTCVRHELEDTLPEGGDVDAELGWLRQALRGD